MDKTAHDLRSVLLAACAMCLASGALAQAVASIAIADKPLRIIRGAAVYKAAAGTILQKDDIIETGGGSAQFDAGPDAIVAMGPETRLYVGSLGADGKAAELQLLEGWLKLASKSTASAGVTTASFQASMDAGAVIVNSKPGKDAMFAEAGEQLVVRFDAKGKAAAPLKVPAEQFAFALAGQPLVLQSRPAKDFLTDMPPQFRDRLATVPAAAKQPKLVAIKERDADFADVAAWLGSSLPARKSFVARFRPRLKDLEFRKKLEQALGVSDDWKHVLKPPAAPHSHNNNDIRIY